MKILKIARSSLGIALLLGGVALSVYGVMELFSLDRIPLGKLNPEGRDAGAVVIFILLGVVAALYGLFSIKLGE